MSHEIANTGASITASAAVSRCALAAGTAVIALLAAGGSALAQQAQGTEVLDPITVYGRGETATGPVPGYVAKRSATASKTDTPLIETPQAVTVVGREQMEDQGVTTLMQAARFAPGISTDSFGADSRNDWFRLRGFSAQETGVYLDGMQLYAAPAGFATWKLEPWGLERVEVLRGPAAILYGGGNPGGLVNAVSKAPPFRPQGQITASVDEFGNTWGAFDFGGPIGNEWAYRVIALGRLGGTQVDDVDNNRIFVAPSVTWRPSDATTVTLRASYQRDESDIQNFLPYVGTVRQATFGRIPTDLNTNNPGYGKFEREQAMIGYSLEHRFSDAWAVRQNLRYSYLKVDQLGLYGVGWTNGLLDPPNPPTLARGNFWTMPTANMFTVDTQAEWKVDTGILRHKVLFGVDYKYYRLDDESRYVAGTPLDVSNPVYLPVAPPTAGTRYEYSSTTVNQLGLYLQDQIKIDRLTLALGGRYDFLSVERRDKVFASSGKLEDGQFSGRAGAIYNFDMGLAPYVSFSTTFNPLVGYDHTQGKMLEPETGESWEAGVKYQPPGTAISLGVAYFDTTRRNVANPNSDGFVGYVTQLGEVKSNGLELEAQAELLPGLNLVAAYTYSNLEISKAVDTTAIGKVPVGAPEQFGSLWLDYTFQSGPLQGFGAGAGVRYKGKTYADPANTLAVPESTVADVALHYERDNWKVVAKVDNVFDKAYVSSCASTVACYFGDRRKASLTASYKW